MEIKDYTKHLFFFFIFFYHLSFYSYSQSERGIKIESDSITNTGFLLNNGWKYQIGDNLDWANPNLDDSNWLDVDPTIQIQNLPNIVNEKIIWLRLNFELNEPPKESLGLAINQVGAAQIFLNGKLFQNFGEFSTNPSKVVAYDPKEIPIYLPISSSEQQTLAIRYAIQENVAYTQTFSAAKNSLFKATIYPLNRAIQKYKTYNLFISGLDIFVVGICFILFILHLSYFFNQKEDKTQLYLSLYLLAILGTRGLKLVGQNMHYLTDRYYVLNFANVLLSIALVLLSLVLYRLAQVRKDRYFYFFIIYQIIYVIVAFISFKFRLQTLLLIIGSFYGFFFILIRMARIGLRKKIKGFLVIGIAILIGIFNLIWISSFVLFFGFDFTFSGFKTLANGISPYLVSGVFTFTSLGVPVGLSLFIGIQTRELNKALGNQINENENLKNKALEHEKEKQQMLTTQNEKLEKLVSERTGELKNSLEILKATQAQLIQSEKLASLGELTAGIAHEIQNPLNFVNNFSELSVDLAEELKEEMQKTEKNWELIEELTDDLNLNQQKISHHGKRAASIVSGMLLHARTSTGTKEPNDLNALLDEYMRLAYHGLRAKDPSFNAKMVTDFDLDIGKVEVISQDFGRVVLNIFNNAFYATQQRAKEFSALKNEYEPTVSISSKKENGWVIIKIKDNGTGMPNDVKAKIFQPFFTTKPTGSGTGLGLSISYDIVTKGHGGTIEIDSKEGEYTIFTIKLPKP